MVGAHGTSHTTQGRGWKCPSFHPSTHVISFGCCVASMGVTLCLVSCTMVDQPHPCTHRWIDMGVNTYMNGWWSLIVHHTPSKAREKSVPVFIHSPMVYHLGVVWPVWMWSSCLVPCAMVYQPPTSTHWWIERGAKYVHMVGAHGTSHIIKSRGWKCASFLSSMFVHPLGVVWQVWMWSPCLVAYIMVYQPHPCTHWWIDRGVNTYMDS